MECLFNLLKGKTAKEIASELKISPKTIDFHLALIRSKLNYRLKSELFKKAKSLGLINYTLEDNWGK